MKIGWEEISRIFFVTKVEVISTTDDNLYNIRINNKIYRFKEGK